MARRKGKGKYRKTYSSNQDFFSYFGNLVFYPEKQPDLHNHFFYFERLLSNYARPAPDYIQSQYRQIANDIGREAERKLYNSSLNDYQDFENSKFLQDLSQAMELLENGIRYEKQNEEKYIDEKIAAMRKKFSPDSEEARKIEAMFNNLKNSEEFDYYNFINLLNSLMSGVKNTEAVYKYEEDHINELINRMYDARASVGSQLEGLAYARDKNNNEKYFFIQRGMERLEKQRVKTYLNSHTYNIENDLNRQELFLKKYFIGAESTKTADVKLANKINEIYKNLLDSDDTLEKIKEIIQQHFAEEGYATTEQSITSYLVETLIIECGQYLNEILNDTFVFDSDQFAQDLQNNTNQMFDIEITGLYSNFAQYGRNLKFFKSGIDELKEGKAEAEGLYDALSAFIDSIKGKKVTTELNDEERRVRDIFVKGSKNPYNEPLKIMKRIERLQNKLKKLSGASIKLVNEEIEKANIDLEKQGVTIQIEEKDGRFSLKALNDDAKTKLGNLGLTTGKNFDSLVATLKRKMSQRIKNSLIEAVLKEEKDNMKNSIMEELRKGIGRLKVSVGGPKLAEIIQLLQEEKNFKKAWTGGLNVKNDSITIVIKSPLDDSSFNFDLSVNNFFNNFEKKIRKDLIPIYEEYTEATTRVIMDQAKQIKANREYTDYDKLASNFFSLSTQMNETMDKVNKKFDEAIQAIEQLETDTQKRKEAMEKLELERQKFLQEIQDTLFISTTTKTFNNYQNDVGFVGGSLGSTIVSQIDSLNTLFSKAGIELSQSDIDWLITASINCSDLSLGKKNKDLIETYLGSLAVFALFDEGGAELDVLRHNIDTTLDQLPNTPKIMHIYRLNGIYYPGSYVLQTALNNIKEMVSLMQNAQTMKKHYNNIIITNNMKFEMLPNKGAKSIEEVKDRNPWETMCEKAERNTSLHVVFLAGLLDTINELKKKMSDVIPT